MTEEEAIEICKNIIRSINGETYYSYSKEQDKEAIETILDLYKKEKEKNKKIKESLTFRVGKSREKENHTMEYEKLNKNNKFGHNGICEDKRHKRKKYRAYITLHGKQYSLGTYDNLETAIKARKNGEEMIKKMKEKKI